MELFLDWTTGRMDLSRSALGTMFLERQFAPLPLRMEQYKAPYTKNLVSNVLENVSRPSCCDSRGDLGHSSSACLTTDLPLLPFTGRHCKRTAVRSAHPQLPQAEDSRRLWLSSQDQTDQDLRHRVLSLNVPLKRLRCWEPQGSQELSCLPTVASHDVSCRP
jgi:hypothetical protein